MNHDEQSMPTDQQFRHLGRYGLILLVVALVLAVWGVASRVHSRNELGKETTNEAVPVVIVQKPAASPPSEDLVLPGNVQAFVEAPLFARTSGYLRNWYTDIGEKDIKRYNRQQGVGYFEKYNKRLRAISDCTDFKPNPNAFSCKWCPYKGNICEFGIEDTRKQGIKKGYIVR